MDTDPILEDLMSQLGDFGRYQLRQHLLHLLSGFLAGVHMLSLTTVAPTPPHRCRIPEVDQNETSYTFNASILGDYIPINSHGGLSSCIKTEDGFNLSCGKGEIVYDTTYYTSSRVIDWDLVCDIRWERSALQSIYMFGVLMGAIILGSLADKYGRKLIFYISGIFQLVFGLACAFVPYYTLLAVALFFYGMFGSGGAYVTGFVLTMEMVGPTKRTLCGTLFSLAFGVGVMVVAFWAAVIPDHWQLQTVFALHSLLILGHWWLIDESVRWLWGQGRVKEAIRIVEKAVKVNRGTFINRYDEKLSASNDKSKEASHGAMDLFKTPVLRSRMLNVAFCWFANSLVYYGLSLNTGELLGNPFLMLFLIGLAEMPAYLLVILIVDKTGRRSLCATLMLIGGIACVAVAFLQKGEIFATILVMLGKFAIAGSFAVTYNYTAELFPTVVRNSAVGVGAMAARFSGSLTPLITLLDSVSMTLPTTIFGVIAITSGLLALFLPETLNKEMPQTLEDGENFGRGDTGYKTLVKCCRDRKDRKDEPLEIIQPLKQAPSSP
ncbi:unnamed protein product [Allacma fusca]|uniref:Major facilitator superfamily (MFS) profile domain-containing protein n=1 Tax=Allacma fusca TaxID=39272 RepID=A0A8J2J4A5_9HEXA|nr:unnamed protein product [Allacma fusca]